MTEVEFLEEQAERLKSIAIGLKVELNISEGKVRKLERQLIMAHEEARELVVGAQTINNLQVLGDSDDDNGQDPLNTGQFPRNPWENAQ